MLSEFSKTLLKQSSLLLINFYEFSNNKQQNFIRKIIRHFIGIDNNRNKFLTKYKLYDLMEKKKKHIHMFVDVKGEYDFDAITSTFKTQPSRPDYYMSVIFDTIVSRIHFYNMGEKPLNEDKDKYETGFKKKFEDLFDTLMEVKE